MDLVILGGLFLVGLFADVVGRRTLIPRVSILLVAGLVIGPSGLGFISSERSELWFPQLTHVALTMVGFLMGQTLTASGLGKHGKALLILSLSKVLCVFAVVLCILLLVGTDLTLALLLAGIAPATAPTATYDVVHESGVRGRFSETLLGVVALDDVWGLILFSWLLAFLGTATVAGAGASLSAGLTEIAYSAALGVALGLPMAAITGRLVFGERAGEPILAESLGFVLVAAGISSLLGLSPILTAIVMGCVVANFARHHTRPFHAIEGVEWPFMILFFVIAGASLRLDELTHVGWLTLAYLMSRLLGIVAGVFAGAKLARLDDRIGRWLGFALFPQAGVALGMALIAGQHFPEQAEGVLTITLASTVLLELGSPVLTRWVLRRDAREHPDG